MANPKIQLRHDTPSNWSTVNPVLLDGEVGIQKAGTQYNVDILGTLTNNNGILSGFSSSNFAKLPNTIALGDNFELCIKVTTSSNVSDNQKILNGRGAYLIALGIYNGRFDFNIGNGNSWINPTITLSSLSPNTTYWFKIIFNNSRYSCKYSTDGAIFTECAYKNSTTILPTFLLDLGGETNGSQNTQYFLGNIDLNDCYILTNNTKIWEGTTLTPTRLKVGNGTTAYNNLPYFMDDAVKSSTITNIVQISQADYDALTTKDANTLYVIV